MEEENNEDTQIIERARHSKKPMMGIRNFSNTRNFLRGDETIRFVKSSLYQFDSMAFE